MLKKIMLGVSVAAVMAASLASAQPPAGAAPARPVKLPTKAQWDAAPGVKTYVDKAYALAGSDEDLKFDAGIFCTPTGGATTPERRAFGVPNSEPRLTPFPTPDQARPMPAARLADNWYRIGDSGVGMWLFTTPQGYILFDAGNRESDITGILEPEMKKLGLDPKLIKYVVIGHYHFDHTGGLAYLQNTYKPKIIMGRDDWPLYFKSFNQPNSRLTGPPAKHDIDATDGMKITVGDTTMTIIQMTGHTPGSLGAIVPVKVHGKSRNLLIVTAGTDFHNREAFIGGYEHIWNAGIAAKVESVMQVHPNTNMNILARMKYVQGQKFVNGQYPTDNHPMFYGVEKTAKYLEILRACSQARMEALGW